MIKCTTCGTDNPDSSQYCDECGSELEKLRADRERNEINATVLESPAFQSASVTSVGIPLIIEEPKFVEKLQDSGDDGEAPGNTVTAKLVIERGTSVGTEFLISAEESHIGRWDADNGIFPDIDLDSHDSEAKVSRRHARILNQNGKYLIEDLGSTNGTFINRGRRLIPGTPNILHEGDEIIVGKTFMRFHVI